MSASLSRRGFLSALGRPFQKMAASGGVAPLPASHEPPPGEKAHAAAPDHAHAHAQAQAQARTAIIQGRFCLALTSLCSVCTERCPVPGAMKKERGLPMVVPGVCTGCGVCHEVCPAPRKAVLLLPRRQPSAPVTA